MPSLSPRQWSIASILQWGILALVTLQSCLLLGTFLAGGVLTSSRDYATQVFTEKVANRLQSLQNDMANRWSRLDETAAKLAALPFVDAPDKATQDDLRTFWQQACPLLLQLMRSAGVTDSFIVLSNSDGSTSQTSLHKALYLRKTDPMQDDSDTNILIGSPHLSLDQGIYFSPSWRPDLTLTPENRDFFDKPLSLTGTDIKPSLMAYWGRPVSVTENSARAITYSMPLMDKNGVVRGILGVGMLTAYFDTLLPAHELGLDGLGYMLTAKSADSTDLFPLIYGRLRQQELFPADKPIQLIQKNSVQNIFQAVPTTSRPDSDTIAACILPLHTYAAQTPFSSDAWQLVGFINENSLYAFPMQIRQILTASLATSLMLGGILAVLFSRRITTPIVNLARSVENNRNGELVSLPRTGMLEIDRLTTAMENANRNMINTTARLMHIADMANVPFGAFELKPAMSQVFATKRLRHLLLLSSAAAAELYANIPAFMEHLRLIMASPEPEEEAVYKISDEPEHWVKIHLTTEHGDILGLVSDATDNMRQKRRIRHERDYDPLTGLCSHTFFRQQVSTLIELHSMLDLAAIIILDLDSFKAITAEYGQECGDAYLDEFSRHLGEFSGIHSILGRRSGNEFFVFAFRIPQRESLRAIVQQFYDRLSTAPFTFPDGTTRIISVSMGLAWFNENSDFEALLRTADTALNEAKSVAPGMMREFRSK